MQLCFATNNKNKITEVQDLLKGAYQLIGLKDIGCEEELEETQSTIEGNSLQKANYVFENYRIAVFADDTGLEVHALNREPGVKSARYAGEERDNEANVNLLLQKLERSSDRSAQFRTIISLILQGETFQFEGKVKGIITEERRGNKGFGYDPVFIPEGHDLTFAEMSALEKNRISHRAKAINKLVDFLNQSDIGRN